MIPGVSAQDLFEALQEKLDWRWVAGKEGVSRRVEAINTNARRPSHCGYLNIIYPNKVQILGTEELQWLDTVRALESVHDLTVTGLRSRHFVVWRRRP